jgi:phage shock protein PspC (stress-responsive transcriptional regulator)
MKKNISINLQGIIFHIEDDGFEVLSRYLHEVKAHFANYQGHEEIVADIEGRIAELFSARLSVNKQVITLTDVEEMTAKMGRVSDFATEPDEEDEATTTAGTGSTFGPNGPFGPKGTFGPEGTFGSQGPFASGRTVDGEPRRLYRDLAHRKIAGVCAGLAQYFLVNPLVVRLIFLALVLLPNVFGIYDHVPGTGIFRHRFDFGGLALIAYVVLWIVLPKRDDAPAPIDTLDFGGKLTGRKLFRDTDTGKVGGVAAGLAAYFQTDVVLIRVLFLVSLFLGGSGFIAYIILWVVVPEARTLSEKMQMRGDAVTLSGIDNNLRAGAFDSDGTTPTGSRPVGAFLEDAARGARPAVDFLGTVIRWGVAGLLIFMGGSSLFTTLSVGAVGLGLLPPDAVIHGDRDIEFDGEPFTAFMHDVQPWSVIAAMVTLAIPAIALMLLGLRLILRRPVVGRTGSLVMLGLWLVSVIGTATAVVGIIQQFRSNGTYTTTRRLSPITGRGIVLDSRNMESFLDDVRFQLTPADSGAAPFVEETYQARGRTSSAARLTAQQSVRYDITQQDSVITFDQGLALRADAPFRSQKLTLKLHLPLDKVYRLMPIFLEKLDGSDFTNGHRPEGNQEHRARFTRQGKFTCLDCPPSSDDDDSVSDDDGDNDGDEVVDIGVNGKKMQLRVNTDGDAPKVRIRTEAGGFNTDLGHYGTGRKTLNNPGDFNEIEAQGPFRVLIRQGDSYRVEAAGRPEDMEKVRLSTDGDRLLVQHRNRDFFSGWNSGGHPILVTITLPRLERLEISGACDADVSGFRDAPFRLEASGAAMAKVDVNVPRIELDLSSASQVDLRGSANELRVEGSSASQLDALKLHAERANLELSSASQAQVHASNDLKVDLSGASSVSYAGNPSNIEKNLRGASSLEQVKD